MSTHDLYEQRKSFFLAPSQVLRGGIFLSLILGVVMLGLGFHTAPVRAWGSFLFNLFFFFSIALGGVVFACMQDVIGATWGRPIKRIHESFGSFLPLAAVLFIIFLVCIYFNVGDAREVYKWIADPELVAEMPGKRQWLQLGPMIGRNIFAVLLIVGLSCWQLGLGLRRDRSLMEGKRQEADMLGAVAKAKLQYWSGPMLVVYAVAFSLVAFDLMMTLSPKWFSTLFAAWMFAIMMQTLLATLLITMFALKKTSLGSVMKQQQFHDVGKMLHGFTIFFAYLTYAHILTYWYGNMPEETEYYIHRLHGPWLCLIIIAPLLNFVLPLFVLIPKPSKWTAAIAVPLCYIILIAQWMVDLIVVIPEVTSAEDFHFPWIELGGLFSMTALFAICVVAFAKRNPMLAVADPLLPLALSEHH